MSDTQGIQQPRVSHAPEFVASTGGEAIELCAAAGLHLDPWQQYVLTVSLGERPDHKWAAFGVGLVVSRQNGKGSVLEARELAGLFLLGERLIVHSAHQFDTSIEHFRRLLYLIESTPELESRVKRVSRSHGEEGIELKSGQRIRFRTRTKGGGRGFTADLVVFDEAMILPAAMVGAVLPTLSTRPNAQVWYTGSAVDQDVHEHGSVLTSIRNRAIAGADPSLAYFEWSADFESPDRVTPDDATNPGLWAQANPALGIRIDQEYVEREQRELRAREFAVERLGVGDWPDLTGSVARVIPEDLWRELAETDESNRIDGPLTFAVDTNGDQTWGSVGVAGKRADGLWQAGIVEHRRRPDWIVDVCVDLQAEHPDAVFVVDPRGPAANLIGDLREAGLQLVEVTTGDYADACANFLAAALDRRMRYPAPETSLTDAVADARTQPMGDRWKWSRKNSTSADISPLVAATLALWGAQSTGDRSPEVWSLSEAAAALTGQQPEQNANAEPLAFPPAHSSVFNP